MGLNRPRSTYQWSVMKLETLELMRSYATGERRGEALSLGLVESTVACRFLALRRAQTRLPLASRSQVGDGLPKGFVLDSGVDFGGRDVPVAECTLHQPEIASLAEEPHGEGVAKRVDGKAPGDACGLKPVLQSKLNLTSTKTAAATGTEQRCSIGERVGIDVQTEESAKRRVKKDRLLSSAFGCDGDSPFSEVHVASVQGNQRAESDAGAKEHREHCVVSSGDRAVRLGDGLEQSLCFVLRQIAWHPAIRRCRAYESCRVVTEITSVGEEAEEHSQRRLGSVDGQGSPTAVSIGEKARQRVRRDGSDVGVCIKPASKLPQVSQVCLTRALALAVCPELCVEALDRCRELHGFTPLQFGYGATSMNALCSRTVNAIMRTICLSWPLSLLLCTLLAHVAATQALWAPISEEVGIDA